MTFQPILQSNLITLRPTKLEDFEELFAVASDEKIWTQHPQFDRYKRDVFQKFFNEGIESFGNLTVIDKSSEKIIGASRFYDHCLEKREITIGCTFLGRQYWGGIYNGEMKRLMIRYAFEHVDSIILKAGPDNIRSQKAIQKVGGRLSHEDEKGHFVFKISKAN